MIGSNTTTTIFPARRRVRSRAGERRAKGRTEISENLRLLAKYRAATDVGDTDAVYEFRSESFHSHVTGRVTPDKVGTDVRGEEQLWWDQVRSSFPDLVPPWTCSSSPTTWSSPTGW